MPTSITFTPLLVIHAHKDLLIPPDLCKRMLTLNIGSCGTFRVNRKGLPQELRQKKMQKGETVTFQDGRLTGVHWMDKCPVAVLSTIHDASMTTISRRSRSAVRGVETIKKSHMIVQYNTYMGGVDIADQLVIYYGFSHHSKKWWKRAFFHILEVCVVNAYILYSSTNKVSHLDFILTLCLHPCFKNYHTLPNYK